jgi:ribonuclease HI
VFLHSHYIHIFCDGASLVHKGKTGGWAGVILYKEYKKEIKGAVPVATNNQMELLACIKALQQIKTTHIPIKVYSDSAYVIDGMNEWIYNWQLNGWKTNKKGVKNKELWVELIALSEKQDDIEFVKVKGHAGNKWNERADRLATEAIENFLTKE